MNMDFTEFKVDPNELRFSQDSIATYVRSPWGHNVPLSENLKKLKSGELHPDYFPQLEVSKDEDGMLWSNDNRRLWLFRRAGISQITVKLFSKPLYRAPPTSDFDRALMSSPDFFPWIRGPGQDTQAVIKLDPNAVRFSQTCIDPYLISRSGQKIPLEENLKKLKSRQLHLDDFLPLDVSRDEDGVLWSNDNERLWLFRKAGISRIAVKVFRKPLSRAPPRSDRDRALMFSRDFFPTIRGQSQETAPTSTQPKADNSDGVVKLNPNLIRFSEKSIASYWTAPSGKKFPLEETLKQLRSEQLHLVDLPPLDVSRDENGVLWSNDNEGLWLCRKAGISQITVKISRKPLSRAPPGIDRDRALMSSQDFFPTIRGQSQETGSTSSNPKADNIDSVVKLNPNAIRFSEKIIGPCWTTSSGRNVPLEEILKLLKSGRVSPEVFQPLEVSRDKNGVLWANDNEELWFLRKAGVSEINVKVSNRPLSRAPPTSDGDRDLMSSPDFFPTWTNVNTDDIVALLVGAAALLVECFCCRYLLL